MGAQGWGDGRGAAARFGRLGIEDEAKDQLLKRWRSGRGVVEGKDRVMGGLGDRRPRVESSTSLLVTPTSIAQATVSV